MKTKLFFLAALFAVAGASAQSYFPMREGAVLEYRYYDNKGKALKDPWRNDRWTRLAVEKMWGDSIANVAIMDETFERLKNMEVVRSTIEGISYGDVRVTPTEVVFENVMWLFPSESLRMMPEMDKESLKDQLAPLGGSIGADFGEAFLAETSTDITLAATARLPRELHVGDTLPEARYRAEYQEVITKEAQDARKEAMGKVVDMIAQYAPDQLEQYGGGLESIGAGAASFSVISATVRNRVIEGFESIETPAGTFECWKIGYDLVGPTERYPNMPDIDLSAFGIPNNNNEAPVILRHVDYLSPEVGLVRREKYNGTGRRIEEVMVLEKVRGL